MSLLKTQDPYLYDLVQQEKARQEAHLELIASENFVSDAVFELNGSVLTNKYAEGYPKKRYYGGCAVVDEIETLAIERAKQLFNVKFANVQAHSGSTANMAAFRTLIHPGDKVLAMGLDHGGHLTHGHHMSFSGADYDFVHYGVDTVSERLDYDAIEALALEHQPKLIIAGASAYPRIIDFKRFRDIADKVGAYLLVDMAHIAGLVAAGLHPNPCEVADIVTSTTHKTLRGPRGGILLTNDEAIAKKINTIVFPGIQGGPLMHLIGAKAAAFHEALDPAFKSYQEQVILNARALASGLILKGFPVISGGTDNHLVLVNVKQKSGLTGKQAEALLESVHITCNKNTIPNDSEKPFITSGIRLGTPALTTRGFTSDAMLEVANLIHDTLMNPKNTFVLEQVKARVKVLTDQFPLY